jgi:hypothetical protein
VSKGPKSGKLKTRKGRASSKTREGLVQEKKYIGQKFSFFICEMTEFR